jgi:AN1-type zinc finger and ubiquitin domain-containing protein 1
MSKQIHKVRCFLCNIKVGINGFECRCKKIFCSDHRYQYIHNCEVNMKTMFREKIESENKLVVSDKLFRI